MSMESKISPEENEELTRPSTLEALDAAIKRMKSNTAPGSDRYQGTIR
jgi:hypothetical protein